MYKSDIAELFQSYAKQGGGIKDIANNFGLHENTVKRWIDKGIPDNYRGDFLRLAGKGCLLYTSPSPRDS